MSTDKIKLAELRKQVKKLKATVKAQEQLIGALHDVVGAWKLRTAKAEADLRSEWDDQAGASL